MDGLAARQSTKSLRPNTICYPISEGTAGTRIIAAPSGDIHHRTRDDPLIVNCRSLCEIEDEGAYPDADAPEENVR